MMEIGDENMEKPRYYGIHVCYVCPNCQRADSLLQTIANKILPWDGIYYFCNNECYSEWQKKCHDAQKNLEE